MGKPGDQLLGLVLLIVDDQQLLQDVLLLGLTVLARHRIKLSQDGFVLDLLFLETPPRGLFLHERGSRIVRVGRHNLKRDCARVVDALGVPPDGNFFVLGREVAWEGVSHKCIGVLPQLCDDAFSPSTI